MCIIKCAWQQYVGRVIYSDNSMANVKYALDIQNEIHQQYADQWSTVQGRSSFGRFNFSRTMTPNIKFNLLSLEENLSGAMPPELLDHFQT